MSPLPKIGLPAVRADLDLPPGKPPLKSPVAYLNWLLRKQVDTSLTAAMGAMISDASLAVWPYLLGIAIDAITAAGWTGSAITRWSIILLAVLAVHVGANIFHHRLGVASWLRAALRSSRLIGYRASMGGRALNKAVPTGEVVTAVATDTMRMGDLFSAFTWFAGAVVSYFLIAALLLKTSVTLGIAVILGMPIVLGILALVVRPLQRRQDEQRDAMGELTTLGSDTVAGLRVLRGIGGEDVFLNRYRQQSQIVRARGEKVAIPKSLMDGLQILLPGLFLAGIMLYASLLALDGHITIGELIAVYGMSSFLAMPLQTANEFAQITARALVAARKILNILRVESALHDADSATTTAAEEELDVAQDLVDAHSGLRIVPGQFTAVVSADPDLAAEVVSRFGRFDDQGPEEAAIRWGEVPLRNLPLARVRDEIVVSEAMPHLFSGPILVALDPHNAGAADPGDDRMSRVTMALWHADGTDVVEQLPSQFADRLSEQGRSLSGGQRQRLALARVLLAQARVLILIEPTSAVDAHSEARIAERVATDRVGKTTVIVSVSPLILEHADRVILLDPTSEQVVAEGTHTELLETNAAYQAVVSRGN
ncbi:MAG TPA: ABC transporter ATP-binding protein [Actinomycetales bacterium]|nr:ABC transporter ATP-binding protein [Actinomycetales bacterium]